MAETLITSAESNGHMKSESPAPFSDGSLFHRRIEFQLAKKPFNGFSNGGGGFRLETVNPSSSDPRRPGGSNQNSGPSSLAGKKPDGSELLDAGLDPELSFGITFRRIGAGLENLGNTCFLNSVLQCLTYTEPLAAYLQSGKHQNSCRTAGFCALCAIQKHVSRALQLTGRSLAPKDLVSNLRCISRNFRNARQEDAHEYMVNLLESMHKCCLPAGIPSESPSAYEKSLVHKIFGGRLRSQVKCMQCSFCSNKFDPFLDLSLEINKADSLHKALTHFTTKEYLDGGERQYQCQKCKQKVKALKQLSVHKAPYVLTIHLKRFGTLQPGQKIDKKVQFGPTLDLKPFVTGPYDGDLKYTLYGVLVHYGWSTHSGHYYSFVRTSSGMWYSLDDHQVRQVSEKMVLDQKAYMLFYVRERRNFIPKQPIKVVQKESATVNVIGSKPHFNSNQGLKETVQNGPIPIRVSGMDSSAAVSQRDAVKESFTKEASIQKTNLLEMAERSAAKMDPRAEVSLKVPESRDAIKGLSDLHPSGEKCLTASSPGNGSGDALNDAMFVAPNSEKTVKDDRSASVRAAPNSCNPQNSVIREDPNVVVAEPVKYNEDRNVRKDISSSVAMAPHCNGVDNSAGDVCDTEKASQKIDIEVSLQNHDVKESKKAGPSKLLEQPNCGNIQIEGFLTQTVSDSGLRLQVNESVKLPSLQSTCISLEQGAVDHKSRRKLKKKLLKSQITSLHLSSSFLFVASLSLRKKKLKKVKQRTIKINNPTQDHLLGSKPSQTDFKPSTSELTRTMPLSCRAHSEGNGSKSSSSKNNVVIKNLGNSNCNILEGITGEEFRDRLGANGTVLATDKQPQRRVSSPLAGTQLDVGRANGSEESRKDSKQNGSISMLIRGLEDTTVAVAHWDGIELTSSRIAESSSVGTVSIGYIGDEWDEEYDKGKRKKVRDSKNVFGGPNPFQEIATKKTKLKHLKRDKSSSGNQPFRI